ncbi:OmpA family protein, partial [Aliarcobacter butzleri]|uniref:OmpA family protein n=1 Tax=Aliarcobacter butzleri TaxID=28197 RepID=UPI003AF4FE1A
NEQQFEKNSSALNSNAVQVFSKIADQYKNSDKKILILGHTDDSGSSEYNQKLSEASAKNVGEIFFKKGVKKTKNNYLGA